MKFLSLPLVAAVVTEFAVLVKLSAWTDIELMTRLTTKLAKASPEVYAFGTAAASGIFTGGGGCSSESLGRKFPSGV